MNEAKRTILYPEHKQLHAKFAEFAGWEMPLWYEAGQIKEHLATRKQCGLFDTCHMGEFMVTGKDTLEFWQKLLTNAVEKIQDYQAQYSFLLNEKGGVIDDCILYRFNEERWMLVCNAGTIGTVHEWLLKHKPEHIEVLNVSDETAKLDIQGPKAPQVMADLIGKEKVSEFKFFRFQEGIEVDGVQVTLSRTGYTGEIGFELYFPAAYTQKLWNVLLEKAQTYNGLPCGLAARDTLRTEAGLPLSGHDIEPERVALGHPWMFAIKNEADFIGKDALALAEEEGKITYLQAFKLDGKIKALPDYDVMHDDSKIGIVTTGVIAPSLNNQPIGFCLLEEKCRLDKSLTFVAPDKKRQTTGKICEMPLLELTSRRKIADFLE